MRVTAIVAGAALVLAACGGEKKTDETQAPAAAPEAAAPAPATGTTHVIEMVMEGTSYKFIPDTMTIKVGDAVTFKGVSGAAHDVRFYPDSIPAGAAAVLNNAIPNKSGDLSTEMVMDGNETTISFAGAPVGVYKFFCLPHQAMGMKGQITVVQ